MAAQIRIGFDLYGIVYNFHSPFLLFFNIFQHLPLIDYQEILMRKYTLELKESVAYKKLFSI